MRVRHLRTSREQKFFAKCSRKSSDCKMWKEGDAPSSGERPQRASISSSSAQLIESVGHSADTSLVLLKTLVKFTSLEYAFHDLGAVVLLLPPIMHFYAVARGRNTGVYTTWPECQVQVNGFKNPWFKKFPTLEEAQEFLESAKTSKPVTPSKVPGSFYAVTAGRATGIYRTWGECNDQINGFPNAVFKKFSTIQEAEKFMEEAKKRESNESQNALVPDNHVKVYTDGACSANGRKNAVAGIGVYWGPGDERNISELLTGRPTNNRAEIHAAVRAVRQAKELGFSAVTIATDSQFMIDSMTKWLSGWKKRNWKLSTGGDVVNREDFEELERASVGIKVIWEKVAAHQGIPGNEGADQLAVAAIGGRQDSGPSRPPKRHLQSRGSKYPYKRPAK